MTDEQIKMLIRLTGEEARMLIDQGEYSLYQDIQDQMVGLVREYSVRLPLNCLQFLYYGNGYLPVQQCGLDSVPPF
ncbi:MAG: hypothetical protein GY792_32580 [Gammaproteobacteria bacterium]|nr:hypothetical protein [Gammaproteobacteria bacterium]